MLTAANNIEGFKWKFRVSIISDITSMEDRARAIDGINELFTKHNMSWNSTS